MVKISTFKPTSIKAATLKLSKLGFTIIPILPSSKRSAAKWDIWEKNQSRMHIRQHWQKHPSHEVGIITNANLIVLDTDSAESTQALYQLEELFDIEPNFTVKTSKGEHHYFYRPDNVQAKLQAHDSLKYPKRIDIKTNRSLVIASPSKGKELLIDEIEHINELTPVTQEFIDALNRHNGVNESEPSFEFKFKASPSVSMCSRSETKAYLEHIDPGCGYQDWVNVGMALHNEFYGSDEGLELFDNWSSKGSKYPGRAQIEYKWRSFAKHAGKSISMATVIKMAKEAGADVQDIQTRHMFDVCEMVIHKPDGTIIYDGANPSAVTEPKPESISQREEEHPLSQFVINDDLEQMKAEASDAVFVLFQLALLYQLTNYYAKPNTGKTLLILFLVIQQIKADVINGKNVFYIDADDSYNGLLEKVELLRPYRVNVVAPGHRDFKTKDIKAIIRELIIDKRTDVILIFDTSKKFCDVMSKSDSSDFWRVLREFSAMGGTVINLAHTNKNDGANGRPIYAGVSDSLDDADCGYTLQRVEDEGSEHAIVEFNNIKSRGNVVNKAFYRYSLAEDLSYQELFESVEQLDAADIPNITSPSNKPNESVIIEAISDCIAEGVAKKMELAKAASEATGIGRNKVIIVMDKYTGTDPEKHRWNFTMKDRGAKHFHLLDT